MIPFVLALAAAAAQPVSEGDAARFQSCTALVKTQPENGVASANDWIMKGGGMLARQCLALGYSALGKWEAAASAFEQAAREAERAQDPRRADYWVQSGNAWLAGGDGVKARSAFDSALATATLSAELKGEVFLDRARAGVQLNDLAGARKDLDQGLQLVPSDPFAWYISSALAVRENNLARAKSDIAKAVSMAPNDADVLLQAGNVAGRSGDTAAAQAFYQRAAAANPASDAGKAAQAALAGGAAPVQGNAP